MYSGIIYVLTCTITGKRYVGQTTNLAERIRHYSRDDCKGQRKLYAAIRKYGWHSFRVDIIMTGVHEDSLDRCEIAFIAMLDTYRNGLNSTLGGSTGARKYPPICQASDCAAPSRRLGYCHKHSIRFRMYGDPHGKAPPRRRRPPCAADGCDAERMTISEYCASHLNLVRKWGTPLGKQPKRCKADGCDNTSRVKGWCIRHYGVVRKYGRIPAGYAPKPIPVCSVDGCDRQVAARGWCKAHYTQWTLKGDPLAADRRRSGCRK